MPSNRHVSPTHIFPPYVSPPSSLSSKIDQKFNDFFIYFTFYNYFKIFRILVRVSCAMFSLCIIYALLRFHQTSQQAVRPSRVPRCHPRPQRCSPLVRGPLPECIAAGHRGAKDRHPGCTEGREGCRREDALERVGEVSRVGSLPHQPQEGKETHQVSTLGCLVLCCIVLYCLVVSRLILFHLVLYYVVSYCFVCKCLVLPCHIPSRLVLYCLILYCLVLSCIVPSHLVLSCIVSSCIVLSCLALSRPISSCLVLSHLVLYCLVLHCPVPSRLVLCCLILSCLFLYCTVLFCLVNQKIPVQLTALWFV